MFETTELVFYIAIVCSYFACSYFLYQLAEEYDHKSPWMAWVPPLSFLLMCDIARCPKWFVLGLLVPYLNFLLIAYVGARMAKRLRRNPIIGSMVVIPLFNIGVMAYFLDDREL